MKLLKINLSKTNFISIILAFILPVILLLITYCTLGIYPFGDKTLLRGDMSTQYVAFLSAFSDILKGNASPFYSFGKVLGGEMIGFGAYYIYSPFNLVTLFFSKENLPTAILIITLLKIGCSGITMYYYLHTKFSYQRMHLFFAVCYALMSYNIGYQHNIMWLDGMLLLPLVVFGLERLYFKQKWMAYSIFLAMSLIFNYYTGYMLCLFAVLYFLYLLLGNCRSVHHSLRTCLLFLFSSLIAAGLAAFVLLPTAYSLRGGKADFKLSNILDFKLNFSPLSFAADFFPKAFSGTSPLIYCGTLIVIGVILYLFSKKTNVRGRLSTLFLLLILFFSMLFLGPDRLWHATAVPAGSPYRYSFLFSFIMIQTACCWYHSLDFQSVLKQKKWQLGLGLFCAVEICFNAYIMLKLQHFESFSEHRQQIQELELAINQLPESNSAFYRMEIINKHCLNDPMHLNYNGLTSYSSSEKNSTKAFAGKMGINDKIWWINYTGETPVTMDSFLGLKYIITDKAQKKHYTLLSNTQDTSVFENPYALPIGIMAEESLFSTNMYTEESIVDVFAIQNQIWNSFAGRKDIFEMIPALEKEREDHSVEYEFSVPDEREVFTNIHNEMLNSFKVFVNNQLITELLPEKQIYSLGTFSPTDSIRVRVESTQNINWYDLFFYQENVDSLSQNIEIIQKNGYQVKEFNGNYFKGSVINDSSDYQYLLLTIPYDNGWEIFVDGTEIEGRPALESLISVPIAPGAHEVVLHFVPEGLRKGIAVSIASSVILMTAFLYSLYSIKRYKSIRSS